MPRYIDADALKDVIQQHDYPLSDKLNSIGNGMFTLGIFQAIDQMSTITPDEVRGVGEWEVLDRVADMDVFRCSACRSIIHCETVLGKSKFAYCPICGAKMEVTSDAE